MYEATSALSDVERGCVSLGSDVWGRPRDEGMFIMISSVLCSLIMCHVLGCLDVEALAAI